MAILGFAALTASTLYTRGSSAFELKQKWTTELPLGDGFPFSHGVRSATGLKAGCYGGNRQYWHRWLHGLRDVGVNSPSVPHSVMHFHR